MAAILEISKYQTELQFDLRYEKHRPKLSPKKYFW